MFGDPSGMEPIKLSTEFWSVLGGAVLGGAIAAGIQLIPLKESRRQRKEDREETRKALGHSIFLKMIRIHGNIQELRKSVDNAFIAARAQGFDGKPWHVVRPFANLPDPVHFSTDEMTLISSMEDDELFELLMRMDGIHNGLIKILALYSTERQSLTDQLPARMEGDKGRIELSPEERKWFEPKMVALDLLVVDLRKRMEKDYEDSSRALKKLHTALVSKLGFTKKLEFLSDQ